MDIFMSYARGFAWEDGEAASFAPLQAPFPLAAGALAKQWCIKELRGSESRYSVLGEQAS